MASTLDLEAMQKKIEINSKRLLFCGFQTVLIIGQEDYKVQHPVQDDDERAEILQQYEAIEAWHRSKGCE